MKGGYNYIEDATSKGKRKGKGKGKGKGKKTYKVVHSIGGKTRRNITKGGNFEQIPLSKFIPYNMNVSQDPMSTTRGGRRMNKRRSNKINKRLIKGGNLTNIMGDFNNLAYGGSLTSFGNTLGNQDMSDILNAKTTDNGNVSMQPHLLK